MPSKYIPAGVFIALAIIFMQKAIRSKAKRTWGWGRVGGEVPVSRVGYAVWGVTFLIIAGVLLKQDQTSYIHFVALGVCVVAIIAIGSIDTWRFRKEIKRRNKHKTIKIEKPSNKSL